MPLVSGADFGLTFPSRGGVGDISPITQALTGVIQEKKQADLLQKQEQAKTLQEAFKTTALNLLDVSKKGDITSKRTAIARMAQNAELRGENTQILSDLLKITNNDEMDTAILQIARRAGDADKQLDEALKAQEPAEKFENILNDKGEIIAQRNSLTGKEVANPRAVKPDEMTSIQKNLEAAGFEVGTAEYQKKLLELIERPTGTTVNVGNQSFKVPGGFMINPDDPTGQSVVPIPGGPGGQASGETAKLDEISRSGGEAITELQERFSTGEINQDTLLAATAPTVFNRFKTADVQGFETLSNDLTDLIGRLRSGGAINTDEEARFKSFLPKYGDKDKTIDRKLKRLEKMFANIKSKVSLAPIKSEIDDLRSLSDEELLKLSQ